jgi:hypothetical protein
VGRLGSLHWAWPASIVQLPERESPYQKQRGEKHASFAFLQLVLGAIDLCQHLQIEQLIVLWHKNLRCPKITVLPKINLLDFAIKI